jgi:tetratricopeptide (TPR) repeat protein
MSKAFGHALEEANRLAQGDQRDAGALFLQGLIEGERGEYESERERYDDAIEYTDQLAEAYWYKGLSYSYQIWDETDNDLDLTKDNLGKKYPKLSGWADDAIECLRKAKIRRSHSAWIPFDYGCEIIRWAQTDEEITEGIEQIILAVNLLDDVRYEIKEQDYLKKVLADPRIVKLLPKKEA